jgi:hypothetical protein
MRARSKVRPAAGRRILRGSIRAYSGLRENALSVIVYVDTSDVREGALKELKAAIDELVEFVEINGELARLT